MSSLYPSLRSAVTDVVNDVSSGRFTSISPPFPSALTPIPRDQLVDRLQSVWSSLSANGDAQQSSSSRHVDLLRSTLELVGKDVVIQPIVSGELEPQPDASDEQTCRFQTALQDRLDIILTLYEVAAESLSGVQALEPGAIFIPLLEELVELIPVETWRDLWAYVETRAKRFTKDMPASRGKALPLLRIINSFLRFLPRTPEDLIFRGRVHQFASSVISVADKSAINMRGDYNDIKTTWDESDTSQSSTLNASAEKEEDGDVKMQSDVKEEVKASTETEFYSTLWSLQHYFAYPPSLDGPAVQSNPGEPARTPFETFKAKTEFVLPKLFEQTQKEKEMMGKDAEVISRKRKRSEGQSDASARGFFHPRFLTGKRLFDHELTDSSFRRQILVQYFILFQFLLNLTPSTAAKQAFTGGMPKTFIVDQENEDWIKSKVAEIKEELRKMIPDGPMFEETVLSIITRERYYAQWKNDSCPEGVFEVPPLDKAVAKKAAEQWRKRSAPPSQYPYKLGSRSLSRLWNRGFTGIDQLKGWRSPATAVSLDEEIKRIEADDEDDKAMGKEPSAEEAALNKDRKTRLTWRGLRQASRTDLRHFSALAQKRDLHILVDLVNEQNERMAVATATDANEATEVGTDDEAVDVKVGSSEPPGMVMEVESKVKLESEPQAADP
ncbi:hypothetical protein M231_03075 [Tremella mesenterica]|uniref:THO complex subunit 1 n=1 Tax=Tremella mesenterica TaxID=5217 RepID=A0A4Q1BPI8_TREME|nr:hypothetical protein M231_03075 [Tremella mesenterica]